MISHESALCLFHAELVGSQTLAHKALHVAQKHCGHIRLISTNPGELNVVPSAENPVLSAKPLIKCQSEHMPLTPHTDFQKHKLKRGDNAPLLTPAHTLRKPDYNTHTGNPAVVCGNQLTHS